MVAFYLCVGVNLNSGGCLSVFFRMASSSSSSTADADAELLYQQLKKDAEYDDGAPLTLSAMSCINCQRMGARFYAPGDQKKTYCHEDCYRAFNKVAPITVEMFGDKSLRCGYHPLNGGGGMCVQCNAKQASLQTALVGSKLGICSRECARDLSRDLQVRKIDARLIDSYLLNKQQPALYEVDAIVQSALWVWAQARDEYADILLSQKLGSDERRLQSLDLFRRPMLEVFNVLAHSPEILGEDSIYFDAALWDSFALFMRQRVDQAIQSLEQSVGGGGNFSSPAEIAAIVSQTTQVRNYWDARKTASTLWRLFFEYWGPHIHPKVIPQLSGAALLRHNNNNPRREQLAFDTVAVSRELTEKYLLPLYEVSAVLSHGLFRDLSPAVPLLMDTPPPSFNAAYIKRMQVEKIPMSLEQAAGLLDTVKRQFSKARDTLEFGKGYSISTLERYLYMVYTVNNCWTSDQLNAFGLQSNAFFASVRDNFAAQIATQDPDVVAKFHTELRRKLYLKHTGKVVKGKVRSSKDAAALAKLCEKAKTQVGLAKNWPQDVAAELYKIFLYFYTIRPQDKARPPPSAGQAYDKHQVQVFKDVDSLFDMLAPRMGTESTHEYLTQLFMAPEAAPAPAPAQKPTVVVTVAAATPPATAATTTTTKSSVPTNVSGASSELLVI